MNDTTTHIKQSIKKAVLLFGLILCLSSGIQFSYAAHKGKGALDNPVHVIHLQDSIRNNYIAALMMMAEQLTTVMMHQVFVVGSFFDAKHQMELNRYFQEKTADAHAQYHPSLQLCSFGTTVRSLSASERRAAANARIFNEAMMDRHSLSVDTLASTGPQADKDSRLAKFKETYCNPSANSGEMVFFCGIDNDGDADVEAPGGGPPDRVDKDIDFMRTLGRQYTVDVDFTDGTISPDEEDIFALSQNLFSHDVMTAVPTSVLEKEQGKDTYQDVRSLHAMRSVAQQSFSNLVGMKSHGSNDATNLVGDYMQNIMLDLGIPTAEIDEFLGNNPSYFAQMEVLTRKMYQHPTFFVNLYQKPDNVRRTGVAIQALELMHDRDRFEAALRREMLISMILETQLREKQEEVSNRLSKVFNAFLDD
jgi:hypothetical protein